MQMLLEFAGRSFEKIPLYCARITCTRISQSLAAVEIFKRIFLLQPFNILIHTDVYTSRLALPIYKQFKDYCAA